MRKLQKGVRSRLGPMHIMAKLKREKEGVPSVSRGIKWWRASLRYTAKKLLKEK